MKKISNRISSPRRLTLVLTLAIALTVLAAIVVQPKVMTGATDLVTGLIPCPNCAFQRNYGAYTVIVSASEGNTEKYRAGVTFDSRSVRGITTFNEKNRAEAASVFAKHETVRTIVTFSRPLSFDEFRKLLEEPGITVHEFTIRNISADGNRTTTFGQARRGDVAPEHLYESMLPDGEKFQGFFSADVTLQADNYANLAKSPDVYLLDITDALVRDDLGDQYELIEVFRSSPYWDMEDLGLAGKQ